MSVPTLYGGPNAPQAPPPLRLETSTGGEALVVVRSSNGNVDLLNGNYAGVALDGLDFRACGESGSESC